MKKPGYYVIHNNKVYNATRDPETKEVILFTEDKSEKRNGFKRDWSVKGLYYKKVRIEEIQYAYHLNNYAIYRGERVLIFGSKDDYLWITADREVAKKVGIPRIDKVSYEMLVNRKEIERLFDEKEPVWGFGKKDEPPNME